MDMMMRFIMALVLYGVMIPAYFFAANLRLPKKNIILGVTIPYAQHEEPAVLAVSASYLKRIRILVVIAALLGLPILFVSIMSVQIFIMMTVIMIFAIGDFVLFVRANRTLMTLKQKNDWGKMGKTAPVVADFRAMEIHNRPFPRLLFAVPCLISAIPLFFLISDFMAGTLRRAEVIAYLSIVVWVPIIVIFAATMRRQNAEVVGVNSDMNTRLTRVRRQEYLRCMAICTWLMALSALSVWFQTALPDILFGAVIILLSVVVAFYAFRAEFVVRKVQEKYSKLAGDTLETDEDAHWIWGVFYHNKSDRRILIKDRIGVNMSMNLARPVGLVLVSLSSLLIFVLPFVGVWAMMEEFTPITYHIEGSVITAAHVRTHTFDLGEEFEVEILDELPRSRRTFGTAIGTLKNGTFSFDDLGSARVLLHTDQAPFIALTTSDGQVMVFHFDPVFEAVNVNSKCENIQNN